ncbi:MAG: neuraminidase-like domain-containing protein [Candidatus Thiodiazotropha taylori]|nr:neuraminidase-like domain-containing protein [Candidatus Thiodiazotropha taylori]
MQKVTPMEPGSQGNKINNLHEVLRVFLQRNILEMGERERMSLERHLQRELEEQVYGEVTTRLVQIFQEQHDLEAGGIVDQATAEAINALLEELGLLEEPASTKPFLVKGRVVHADGRPFNTGLVRAFDKDLRHEQPLGESWTDRQGCYEIHYSPEQFARAEKESADLQLRAISLEGEEVAHSDVLFNAKAEETIDLVVGNKAYRGASEYEELVRQLTPICQEVPFAELKEDEEHQDISFLSGEIGIDPQRIEFLATAHHLLSQTDIPAEVFYGFFRQGMPTDLRALLMQSQDVLRRALEQAVEANIIPIGFGEQIDEMLDRLQGLIVRQAFEQPAEEREGAGVVDLLKTVMEEERHQQEFVAEYVNHKGPIKTFWQKLRGRPEFGERVPELQFTLQIGVLTRNHLPLITELQRKRHEGEIATVSDLSRYSEGSWRELITSERGDTIGFPPDVPGKDNDEKARNYARALTNMMEDSFPTAFVRHRIEDENLEGTEELVTFLRKNPEYDIKRTHLGTFLAENPASLTGMSEMLKHRLSAIQRVYKVAPRYSKTSFLLGKGIDSAYAISRLGKKQFALMYGDALGGQAAAMDIFERSQQVTDTAMAFLPEVMPDLGVSVRAVGENDHKQIGGQPDWRALFGSLDFCDCEHCNSVYGPSAYLVDILHFLKDRKLVEIQLNEKEEIISRKFKQKTLPNGTSVDKTVVDVLFERRADLGEIELTCENTKTPVPYVDLVNEILEDFIAPPEEFKPFTLGARLETNLNKGALSEGVRQAFKVNGKITLNKQASVRVRKTGQWWTVDDLPFSYTIRKEQGKIEVTTRGRQTNGTPEELGANPQYINTNAYDTLRAEVFPWQSPFDLWTEEARVYLDHLGVKRHQIMETFLPGDRGELLVRDDIAHEYLGFTTPETDLITGVTTSQPGATEPGLWNLWGFSKEKSGDIPDPADSTKWIGLTNQQDWLDTLNGRVDVFLQQSGLKYKDLLDLLVTNTINPVTNTGERAITIQSKDNKAEDTCELQQLKIVGLDEPVAHGIIRFVRLWRKLDCHLFDLDKVLLALGKSTQQTPYITPHKLDDSFLVSMSHVMRLHADLKEPLEHLAAWWAPNLGDSKALRQWWTLSYIDHHAKGQPHLPSLYARLFRNKEIANPIDPAFTEDPSDLQGKLSSHEGAIAAPLGISAEDVSLLDAAVMNGSDTLSLDSLSELFRHAHLAKALKLKIRDYLSILALSADNPFASPLATLLFTEQVETIRKSGFSVTELDYLLRHTDAAVTEAAPTDEEVAIFLGSIRSKLQTISAENTFRQEPSDPNGQTLDQNGDVTRGRLAQLNWDGDRINQIVATFNNRVTYRAPLAALPAGLVLPNDAGNYEVPLAQSPTGNAWWKTVKNIVSYDQNASKLRASRYLNPPDRVLLLKASNDQNYQASLKELFKQQDELQGEISYDPKTKALYFLGVMTKVRREKLKDVSNTQGDEDYKKAVNKLFEAPRQFTERNLGAFTTPLFSQSLKALPPGIQLPATLKGKIYHDEIAQKLFFQGAMSEVERELLLSLSNDAAYQTAIKGLFEEPSKGSRYKARLFNLPTSVIFTPTFQDRIYHDEVEKELYWWGKMTDADRNTLVALSNDSQDPYHTAYQAAIRYLFKISAEDAFLAPADIHVLFDDPTTAAKRFEHLLKKLLPYLRTVFSRQLVIQKAGETLGLEAEAAERLMTTWISWPGRAEEKAIDVFRAKTLAESSPNLSIDRDRFGKQFDTYLLLHKIALVISSLALTPKQLQWLFEYGPMVGWPDMNRLPLKAINPAGGKVLEPWEKLWKLCRLRDLLPGGENILDKLLDTATSVHTATSPQDKNEAKTEYTDLLTATLEWTEENLKKLVGDKGDHTKTGFLKADFPVDFGNEQLLWRLQACFAMLKRLGMTAKQCGQLSESDVADSTARNVRQAVRAKYEETQWLKLAKPLRNVLREKQRAALVAYLLAHPDEKHSWRKVSDIYGYFLIDVEMSPCQMTSRIRQATLSVQLFVQRCLMHLEPEVLAGAGVDEKWLEWVWMKNYRVWEANRKVFLYPENWIEPELRDDKSPFFKALESELMQSDLTKETAEEAFRSYLEKLDQVARLEIVGMHHQVEKDLNGKPAVDILHVFGRTHAIPHVYYYRQLVDGKDWTAWERIDLDIEGDHLIPVMWNRRLYLFWPIFTEKAEPLQAKMPKAGESFDSDPKKYWEIKLAWSERKQGKWVNKSLSTDVISIDIDERSLTEKSSNFYFRALVDNDNNLNIVQLDYFTVKVIGEYPFKNSDNYEQYVDGIVSQGYSLEKMYKMVHDEFGIPPVANAFIFYGCGSSPTVGEISALDFLWNFDSSLWLNSISKPIHTIHEYMWLDEERYLDSPLYLPAPTDTPALAKTPGRYRILPHPDGKYIGLHPFFFQDGTRTFYVTPPEGHWPLPRVTSEDETEPDVSEIIQLPELYYEIPPVKDLLGPIIDIVDPSPFESFVPSGPGPFASSSVGGVLLPGEIVVPEAVVQPSITSRLSRTVSPGRAREMGRLETGAAYHLFPSREGFGRTMMAETGPETGMLVRADNYLGSPTYWRPGYRPLDKSAIPMFRERRGYRFETFYHPYVCAFIKELNAHGVDGLLHRPLQLKPHLFLPVLPSGSPSKPLDFNETYSPTSIILNSEYYPKEEVDFSSTGGYSLYNWELFFHTPFLIANRLSQNQRFEEAQKWFHYIFDPTDTSTFSKPRRYWRTKPFFDTTEEKYQNERLQNLLRLLAKGKEGNKEYDELVGLVQKWRRDPFKPHLIARLRTTAYQKNVVMKYIDNLIAWGDQLFRRETMESLNEATQLYILAADLLGKRPEEIPPRTIPTTHTYRTLEPYLGEFSNALVQIEEFISPSAAGDFVSDGKNPPVTLPDMLYFCTPKNKKLLGYWDTVEDRLFKLRHCMNIEGVVRQLPLFAPPIDPALLVKAAAAGLDISSALNDINAPLPYYRFNVMAQKATELCAELKSLGATMLSALEKRDAEDLALLRTRHEVTLLKRVEQVKKDQVEEAKESLTALQKSRDVSVARYLHYQKLLGVKSPKVPAEGDAIPDHSPAPHVSIKEEGGVKIIPYESSELEALKDAKTEQERASWAEIMSQVQLLIPIPKAAFWGVGVTIDTARAATAVASRFKSKAAEDSYRANRHSYLSRYALRAHDWTLQNNLAARDIMQIDKQILAAEIRKTITERELDNHKKQIEQAKETEQFMKDKYTNRELYNWMVGQISSIYFQSHQLAYDVAKRAERAYRQELGLGDSNFIQFGYWDSLRKGLLSGETLFQDIKRMEVSYLEKNRREYEITKHVSLLQVDPLALIKLRTTGVCEVSLPEELFDMDGPGQYFRRIKNVALSVPCVTGPYAGVDCKLTLLKSSIRRAPTASGDYSRIEEDERFIDYLGSTESIVASSGQNDNGLFETNLRDERYLPFEGAGVISQWRLELPANPSADEPQQFDYATISDVILHIRYTARDGGEPLRSAAMSHLQGLIDEGAATGMSRLFSIRHEFPTEWAKFKSVKIEDSTKTAELSLELKEEHYPFWSQGRLSDVERMDVVAKTVQNTLEITEKANNAVYKDTLDTLVNGLLMGELKKLRPTNPVSPEGKPLKLFFNDNTMEELWILLAWK